MNLPTPSESTEIQAMSRREAIRRATLFLGVAITPSLLTGVMQAAAAPGTVKAKPIYLSAKQFEIAGALAERILPRTDTPGALDVGVPAFIDLMYGKYLAAEDQKVVAAGLAEVEAASLAAHKKIFTQLTGGQQDAVLTAIAEASKTKTRTFFHQIKELTVLGYFTSEIGGKEVLHYDPVPGRFDACIPLADVGNRTWTKER
jgi:gluconate 2-dehydrogenase gamma chain